MTEDEINELHHKRILKNETVHKILDTVLDKIPLAQGTVPNSYLLGTCSSSNQGSADRLIGLGGPVLIRKTLVQTVQFRNQKSCSDGNARGKSSFKSWSNRSS